MSGTIGELALSVDSSDAVQAATDLDKMVDSGKKAEDSAGRTGKAWEQALSGLTANTQLIVKELQALNAKQDTTAQLMSTIGRSFGEYSQGASKAASAANDLAVAETKVAESADQAKARIMALIQAGSDAADSQRRQASAAVGLSEAQQGIISAAGVAATAQNRAALAQESNAASAQKLATSTTQAAAAVGVQGDALDKLLNKLSPTRKATADFNADLATLAAGFKSGQLTSDQYQAGLSKLNAEFGKLSGSGSGLAGLSLGTKQARENFLQLGNALAEGNVRIAAHNILEIGTNAGASALKFAALAAPVLVVAAALGLVAYAYNAGSQEQDAYNKSLILTGNYAGTSAGQLADMARQVSATVGTTGAAAAALASLAGTGKIASSSFEEITEAAVAMERATGKSVDSTIAEFVKIADDPVAAAKSLNEQFHFLTASTYAQIVALKEQGDTIGATKLLTDDYATAVKDRAGQITQNLGLIERGWKGIKDAAAGALDATLNIGRQETLEQQIQGLKTRLADPESYSNGPDLSNYDGQNSGKTGATQQQDQAQLQFLLEQKNTLDAIAKAQGLYGEQQKTSIDAQDKLNASLKSTASNQDKLKARLEEINALAKKSAAGDGGTVYTDAQLNQLRDAAKKEFADKPKAGSVDLTSFNDAQNSLKSIQAGYSNAEREIEAAQKAGLISQESYSEQRSSLIQQEAAEVQNAYALEISALEAIKNKSTTTAEQRISLDQKIADARTAALKAQQDASSQQQVLADAETGRLKKQTEAITTYNDALKQQVATLRQQGLQAAAGLGQGDRERGLTEQLNGIDTKTDTEQRNLASQYGDGSRGMSLEEYNTKLKDLKDSQQALRDTTVQNYDDMTKAQGDWTSGATSAYQNYLDSARDVSGQTKSLFTNAFSSMDDAVANFAVSGKLSFSDFTKSIIADLARIASRQASSSILSSLFGAGLGALGGAASGAASGAAAGSSFSVGDSTTTFNPQLNTSGLTYNAVGGVYDGPGISAYSGSVVSKPTMFAFAKGTGLMGEAGPEAIMPLTRGANGKLGVQAVGGGSGSTPSGGVVVSINIASDGKTDVSSNQAGLEGFGDEVGRFVEAKYKELESKSLSSQGNIRKAINGRG